MVALRSVELTPLPYRRDPSLPTDLAHRRIGIEDPRLARVVTSILTRILADHRDPKVHNAYVLGHALPEYAAVSIGNGASLTEVATFERTSRLSTPTAVHRRLGVTFEDLRAELERLERITAAAASFEVNLLCHYFSPELWRIVAQIVRNGPAAATERLERHLHEFSRRSVIGNRNRAAGRMSASMIRNRANAFRQLMRRCTELRWSHPDADVLLKWESLPAIELPDGEASPLKNTAPPWHLIRHSWWSLNARIWERLRIDNWEDEGWAIRDRAARSTGWAEGAGLHLLLRDRALLGFIAVIGARRGATATLRRRHFVRDYRYLDGRRGPAIELTPLKTRTGRTSRFKPIPEGLAVLFESMIAYTEVRIGRALVADDPLWYSTFSPTPREMVADSISARFSGTRSGAGSLVPFDDDDPVFGYSAHTVRAAAAQSVLSFEAQGWLAAQRIDAHPISIAEALLDHENMKLDEFGYHGAKKVADRERLSAIGAEVNWLRLTTPLGARKTHDAESYRKLLYKRAARVADRDRWSAEKRALRREATEQARARDFESVVYVNVQADLAADHEADAVNKIAQIDGELRALELNPRRLVVVPDDVPNEEIVPVDLEAIQMQVETDLRERAKLGRHRRRVRRRTPHQAPTR